MDEIELLKLQNEALSYLRDNITKDEAYYILTTDKDIIEILIADKKDGSKRIKILDMEYTVEKDDMLLLFDTDGIIDECLLVASYIGVNMYFRRQDVNAILNNINREKVMKYPYIAIQLDNIQTMIRWILCLFILWLEYYESEKDCERKRYCEDIGIRV